LLKNSFIVPGFIIPVKLTFSLPDQLPKVKKLCTIVTENSVFLFTESSVLLFTDHNNDLDKNSLTDILRIGTSVGGARAKALIAIKEKENGDILEIRPGDVLQQKGFSYWILKIDGANKNTLGEGEGIGR